MSAVAATTLTYLFDPLCGWCYGASEIVSQLASTDGIRMSLAPTGLFAGAAGRAMDPEFAAFAWSNDQRIEQLTGQPFSAAYRQHVLASGTQRFDSHAATLALTAVARRDPNQELPILHAIQQARYVFGRDVTSLAVLSQILRECHNGEAAEDLKSEYALLLRETQMRIEAGQSLMQRHGVRGVPMLLAESVDAPHLLGPQIIFSGLGALLTALQKS